MSTNYIIQRYNEIFVKNGYVHIGSDDLRLSYRIDFNLRKYNRSSPKKDYIKLDLSISEKLEQMEKVYSKRSENIIQLIIGMLKLKLYFIQRNIKENEIQKKRKLLSEEIQKLNPNSKVKIKYSDILYDENAIIIEKVDSLSQFTNKINKNELIEGGIYYRGQQNINWSIEPSIFRGNWINHEKEFIHEILISNPQDFEKTTTTLEKLTKMQHYNVPTRLLDLTKNPYIALYFACEPIKYSDEKLYGEIVFFKSIDKGSEKYFDSDTVSIVSNISMMDNNFSTGNENLDTDKFNAQADIPYLLHQIKYEKPNFLNIIQAADLHKCFIIHVKLDNRRIINQQGLFLLIGMGKDKTKPADIKKSVYCKDNKQLVFVISDNSKKEIIKQLDTMNINKKFIYPEIDDVADYLKTEIYKQ